MAVDVAVLTGDEESREDLIPKIPSQNAVNMYISVQLINIIQA